MTDASAAIIRREIKRPSKPVLLSRWISGRNRTALSVAVQTREFLYLALLLATGRQRKRKTRK